MIVREMNPKIPMIPKIKNPRNHYRRIPWILWILYRLLNVILHLCEGINELIEIFCIKHDSGLLAST